jgi:hypothetical protein
MFGSQVLRVVRAALSFTLGAAGVLVLVGSLLIALASPAASAVTPSGPSRVTSTPGAFVAPSAVLSTAVVDDLRGPLPRASAAVGLSASAAVCAAGGVPASVFGVCPA